MSIDALQVTAIDLRNATQREYEALSAFQNALQAERIPEDPPTPLSEHLNWWKHAPEMVCHQGWIVWNDEGTSIIADAGATFRRTNDNQHVMDFGIGVLPAYRRQGLATRILAAVADYTQQQGRRLLISNTNDRVPAGGAFLQSLGAERSLETHLNQLAIDELNRDLVNQWLQHAPERSSGFELGFWEGPYPEADLEAIANLHGVMNTAPRGTLDVEDFHVTPAMLRDWEQMMLRNAEKRWTTYVRERATGAFAGFSEVFWNPHTEHLLWQGATGVFPHYRQHGLGKWLKAAMIERVLRELPTVRYIRTGNADSNVPMLKINYELGFKPFMADYIWQVDLAKVQAYLRQHEDV
jgi:GNAT superfamily N-acetyltransferase